MNVLEVNELSKSFSPGAFQKKREVLKQISFKVQSGITTGFVGINGAGKTTTLKCILGFIQPSSGSFSFFGRAGIDSETKRSIGYLPERPYYYEFLSAKEFLKFHWSLSESEGSFSEACDLALSKVNLLHAKDRLLREFSKGMLQRVGMAQALIHRPQFLILDEPMSGLDPDGRVLIKDIIRDEQSRGTSIFFSSHLLSDMDELCQNLVVIDHGSLIYEGDVKSFAGTSGVERSFKALRDQLQLKKGQ